MKKEYTKPKLDSKAFAQFENVFTACSKGNESKPGCYPESYGHPNEGFEYSAAYKSNTGS